MVQENQPGGNASIDQDPTPDRPLGDLTRQFLQTYKASDEFTRGYNLMNFPFLNKAEIDRLSDMGKRQALWVQAFADRLFGVQALGEADSLLEPWMRWGKIHSEIWHPYYNEEPVDEDYGSRYKKSQELFNEVPIPEEIREYQGNLTDEDLKSLADRLSWLARDIRETIDLTEGLPKPVSMETVFRTQRILGRSVEPAGGLKAEAANKPNVRRIEHEGEKYFTLDFDKPAGVGSLDTSSEQEWQRWERIAVGTHVRYIYKDYRSRQRTLEAGTVQGFALLGAGDAMLFAPAVSKIGVIVVNEDTRFYRCPLVEDIRLDDEEFVDGELSPRPPEPVEMVEIKPETGEVIKSTFSSMEAASEAIVRQLSEEFKRE